MHAALVTLTIDPDQAPAAAEALVNDLLPTVRSAPGFVAAYWLCVFGKSDTRRGRSVRSVPGWG